MLIHFLKFNESAGERKEVSIGDEQVLLFWYRNDIVAIEPRYASALPELVEGRLWTLIEIGIAFGRSPAEGAYSEGFISSKLTPVRLSLSELSKIKLHAGKRESDWECCRTIA